MDYSITEIAAICAMLAAAGLIQGYCGFGYGIVAIALLAMLPQPMGPLAVIVTATALPVILTLLIMARGQGAIDWRSSMLLLIGGFCGTPIGYAFINFAGEHPVFRLALATYLVIAGLLGLRSLNKNQHTACWMALPAGLLSGFLSGAFVTGGPPIVLYLYGRTNDPRRMKATIQLVFVVLTTFRLLMTARNPAHWSGNTLLAAGVGTLAALIPLTAGHLLAKRSSVALFKRIVNGAIILLGVFVGIKALV